MTGLLTLGIVPAGVPQPSPFATMPAAPGLALVLATGARASTPQDRLAACVEIHEASPAFLPWPPRIALMPQAARHRVAEAAPRLSRLLAASIDRAELTLALPLADGRGATTKGDGRTWLAQRAAARREIERSRDETEAWLTALARALDAELAPPRAGSSTMWAALSLVRAPADRMARRLRAATRTIGPPPHGAGAVVTGPWPLFSFCTLGDPT